MRRVLDHQFKLINYKFTLGDIVTHPMFSGSAIMIIGTNFTNFMAYIYHLILGRMLGPANYGDLAAILSLLGIISSAFTFLGLVIVKFVSAADEKDVGSFLKWFTDKSLKLGILLFVAIILLTAELSKFLHIDIKITFLVGPIILVFLLAFVYKAFLQGMLRFKELVIVSNMELFARLALAIVLVYLGLSVFGATMGILLSAILSYFMAKKFLSEYKRSRPMENFGHTKKIINYAIPVFILTLSTNSFFSSDVILVKHYFQAHDAGIYAALSNLGKIIFFGTGPVASVMFPIISKRHSKGSKYLKVFMISVVATLIIALLVLGLYYVFPLAAVELLYGKKFIEVTPYLIKYGVFITIFTLANLFAAFYMSIEKTKVAFLTFVFALIQIFGIYLYHDSVTSVINISIYSSTLLLIFLSVYFIYSNSFLIKKSD